MDNQSIAHTTWNCTYHMFLFLSIGKKILFGQVRKDVGEILRKLCEMKGVGLIEGATRPDQTSWVDSGILRQKAI